VNEKAIEDLSPTGFRLMFHNSIATVSSLRLGQLGFRSSSLMSSSHRKVQLI
jgi:hypothetical protein